MVKVSRVLVASALMLGTSLSQGGFARSFDVGLLDGPRVKATTSDGRRLTLYTSLDVLGYDRALVCFDDNDKAEKIGLAKIINPATGQTKQVEVSPIRTGRYVESCYLVEGLNLAFPKEPLTLRVEWYPRDQDDHVDLSLPEGVI